MHIEIQIKDVYGNKTIYPICEKAKLFAAIAGTKTLTQTTLTYVEKLGYDIIDTTIRSWKDAK